MFDGAVSKNTVILSITIFKLLTVCVLFQCMCPKNYSEWRASWYKSRKGKKGYYKQIRETVPMNLEGHKQVGLVSLSVIKYVLRLID